MPPDRIAALLVLLMGLGIIGIMAGCGESDTPNDARVYTNVRAEFMGTATGGREMVVHHERIPDFMPAMVMTLPLDDTSAVRKLQRGDAMAFDLVVAGASVQLRNLRALPDTVTLDLGDELPADSTDRSAPN